MQAGCLRSQRQAALCLSRLLGWVPLRSYPWISRFPGFHASLGFMLPLVLRFPGYHAPLGLRFRLLRRLTEILFVGIAGSLLAEHDAHDVRLAVVA
jgi:hypothetical protein